MHDHELRRIEEAAAVEPVYRDEISPVLAAVGEVEIHVRAAEATVAGGHVAVRCRRTQARTRGHVNDQTRFVAELSGWSTGDDRHRLHGIEWNLIGKYFALLIGDGLAVERKRVLGMIAHTVEKSIGIGCDPW